MTMCVTSTQQREVASTLGRVTLGGLLRTLQAVALLCTLVALAGSGFFGAMAWMGGAPLHASRRWLRWTLYPLLIWLTTLALVRLLPA